MGATLDLMASDLTVIVLAAGGGTRMKSKTAKVLHEIGGRIDGRSRARRGRGARAHAGRRGRRSPARAGRSAHPGAEARRDPRRAGRPAGHRPRGPDRGRGRGYDERHGARGCTATPRSSTETACATSPRSTRPPRARSACSAVSSTSRSATAGSSATTRVTSRRSWRSATRPPQQRDIREIGSGIFAFDAEFLVDVLPRIGNDNAKGEYYLTDAVGLAREAGLTVDGVPDRRRRADPGSQRPGPARRPRTRAEPADRRAVDARRASP